MTYRAPNLFTAFEPQEGANVVPEGTPHCGVVLLPDGSFRAFSHGIDPQALTADDAGETDPGASLIRMGEKLMAISVALSNDQIMSVLLDLAANTEILDLKAAKNVH